LFFAVDKYRFAVYYYRIAVLRGGEQMDKKSKILSTFGKVLPELTEPELDRLLAFGEGMAFKAQQQKVAQLPTPLFSPKTWPEV
jgi:hypothetical protein